MFFIEFKKDFTKEEFFLGFNKSMIDTFGDPMMVSIENDEEKYTKNWTIVMLKNRDTVSVFGVSFRNENDLIEFALKFY